MILIDYLEQGRMINDTYYAGETRRLCQKLTRKRRGKTDSRCYALAQLLRDKKARTEMG